MILFQFSVSDQAHSKIDTAVTDVVGPLVFAQNSIALLHGEDFEILK